MIKDRIINYHINYYSLAFVSLSTCFLTPPTIELNKELPYVIRALWVIQYELKVVWNWKSYS